MLLVKLSEISEPTVMPPRLSTVETATSIPFPAICFWLKRLTTYSDASEASMYSVKTKQICAPLHFCSSWALTVSISEIVEAESTPASSDA